MREQLAIKKIHGITSIVLDLAIKVRSGDWSAASGQVALELENAIEKLSTEVAELHQSIMDSLYS